MILGFEVFDFFVFIVISMLICITLCTLAMEASVLFLPAFLFLFPFIIANFPDVTPNEAIGLAITIEFFGYTSSVTGYWLRGQVDFRLGMRVLAITVPLAIVGRLVAYFVPGNGLLLVFGLVLIGLAFIIFREYQGEIRHTCLLCGDSLTAMRFDSADKAAQSAAVADAPTGKRQRPRFNVAFDGMDRGILSIGGAFGGFGSVRPEPMANMAAFPNSHGTVPTAPERPDMWRSPPTPGRCGSYRCPALLLPSPDFPAREECPPDRPSTPPAPAGTPQKCLRPASGEKVMQVVLRAASARRPLSEPAPPCPDLRQVWPRWLGC